MEVIILCSALFAFLVVIFVMMLRRSLNKRQTPCGENGNREKGSFDRSVSDIIPIKYYDETAECFVCDGQFVDMIRINAKDLLNMAEDDVQFDIAKLGKLYKTFEDDLKIISMNFPCITKSQQDYMRAKLKTTNDPMKKYWIQRKLDEEIWLEKNKSVREYYLMFFSDSTEKHEKNKRLIFSTLSRGVEGLAEEIDADRKKQVLSALNNKFTVIG